MRLIKITGWILISILTLFILFLLFATFSDYKPAVKEIISESAKPDTIRTGEKISCLLWNIGYCGLGREMDFFYDGGSQVRTSYENTLRNFSYIKRFLAENDSCHFILLQEVDIKSKRTYRINEADSFDRALPNHHAFFALNYKVKFVPVPPLSPLGKVNSGLLTLAKYLPGKCVRHNYPGDYSWPTNLFMLDRCFMVNRYPLPNGKEFLVINSHNSAFDDGSLKIQEMQYLKDFMMEEYGKGNYILVGADWNQNPPDFTSKTSSSELKYERFLLHSIDNDFMPEDWKWIYYPSIPSNRNLKTPYDQDSSSLTILDFFLLSPNLRKLRVKTLNLQFEYSDHQPVLLDLEIIDNASSIE
ncbi:MAG: hypothetical protein JSV24_11010 [Bacteroidales bacterium]|nr:MAG: hypothetical protein JSV24_11010 [Bacteroidales bacterium]